MIGMTNKEKYISSFYSEREFPALAQQIICWKKTRPLEGMKILDGTPVFRNTMVKYCALLAGGAGLTVSAGKNIPADPQILEILPRFNIRVATEKILQEKFDACIAKNNDPAYWIRDGVHPTVYGHEMIAREWLSWFKSL